MQRSLIFAILLISALVTACSEQVETEPVVHPLPDHVPHYDNEHVLVDRDRSISELDRVPRPINLLAAYLDDPARKEATELNVRGLNRPWHFRTVAISDNRLVMLNIMTYDAEGRRFVDFEPLLLEYCLQDQTYRPLGEEELPSFQLRYAKDLKRQGDLIYVASGRHYSTFDCSDFPCTFDRTVEFPHSLSNLAPVSDVSVAVIGQWLKDMDRPLSEHWENVIRVFPQDDGEEQAFGLAYNSGTSYPNTVLMRYAMLRYSETVGHYTVMYPQLPFLYVYDKEGVLDTNYQFDVGLDRIVIDTGEPGPERFQISESNPRLSYYLLTEMDGLGVVVRESIEREDMEDEEATYRYDYHAIDLEDEETYHIGTDTYVGDRERLVFVTEAGLVLHDGEGLYFIRG